uniref:Uncharacterized protein n=1 Tax=Favella ehrenbergii TaxID=182087 RepID=A0A7S3HTX2_9SPIT|mmetsp:Transcript_10019/g.12619  ORF Transcript_10019/g.12619 Transcript_10019/m.12619 type:complete len:118 (+) Transcript_10019:824-1177(+)
MMYASSLSPLYKDYVAYFLILCGLHLTWVTAIFNLSSTAGAKFDWLFLEPLAFFLIVCADSTAVLPGGQAKLAYVSFFLWTLTRYLLLMKNIVQQITTHMGLRFLKVKPRVKTAKAD